METHKLNSYLFSWFFALFLCIGIAHSEVVEHDCYLSNSTGGYLDLKGKTTEKPIYLFNWEVENKYVATIKRPYPIEDRNIEIIENRRHITFKHSYCGKTPIIKKNVLMTDKWELVQSDTRPPQSGHKGEFLDLKIILDTKHNILDPKYNIFSKEPTTVTHKLFCSETVADTKKTNIHIVPKDNHVREPSSEENSTYLDDEGSSYKEEYSDGEKGSGSEKSKSIYDTTFFNEEEGSAEEQCSSASYDRRAEDFWAEEGQK